MYVFAISRSFYPSTSSTTPTSVRADSSIVERHQGTSHLRSQKLYITRHRYTTVHCSADYSKTIAASLVGARGLRQSSQTERTGTRRKYRKKKTFFFRCFFGASGCFRFLRTNDGKASTQPYINPNAKNLVRTNLDGFLAVRFRSGNEPNPLNLPRR